MLDTNDSGVMYVVLETNEITAPDRKVFIAQAELLTWGPFWHSPLQKVAG